MINSNATGSRELIDERPHATSTRGQGLRLCGGCGRVECLGASVFEGSATARHPVAPRARGGLSRMFPSRERQCFDTDMVFDAAIHDGMHVLSLSLGGDQQNEQSLGRQQQSIVTGGVDSLAAAAS